MGLVDRVRLAMHCDAANATEFRDATHRLRELQHRRSAAAGSGRQKHLDDIEDEIAQQIDKLLAIEHPGAESLVCKAMYLEEALGDHPDDLAGELALSLCREILRRGATN